MNLYKLTRPDDHVLWGDYISAVVVCDTPDEARLIHPSGDCKWIDGRWINSLMSFEDDSWIRPSEVIVQHIGVSREWCEKGVLTASLNRPIF